MSELDQASNGGLGLAFLLSEMRDFRKGLEARDERINGSIDGLRSDVSTLSAALTKSQDHVSIIEGDVQSLKEDVHAVRRDVDTLMVKRHESETAWDGPKKLARNITLIAAGLAGIAGIVKYLGPAIIALL